MISSDRKYSLYASAVLSRAQPYLSQPYHQTLVVEVGDIGKYWKIWNTLEQIGTDWNRLKQMGIDLYRLEQMGTDLNGLDQIGRDRNRLE